MIKCRIPTQDRPKKIKFSITVFFFKVVEMYVQPNFIGLEHHWLISIIYVNIEHGNYGQLQVGHPVFKINFKLLAYSI